MNDAISTTEFPPFNPDYVDIVASVSTPSSDYNFQGKKYTVAGTSDVTVVFSAVNTHNGMRRKTVITGSSSKAVGALLGRKTPADARDIYCYLVDKEKFILINVETELYEK